MKMETHLPSAPLQPFIRSLLLIETGDAPQVNRVLPGIVPAIAFRFRGQTSFKNQNGDVRLPATVITGLRMSARLIGYERNSGNIIVLFKAAGAAAFFKQPLQEVFEETVSLSHFIAPSLIRTVEERLAGAGSNAQRLALVESFLLRLLRTPTPDLMVAAAIQKIQLSKGTIKIKSLAAELYSSQDAFEKRFRKAVGSSPKQFASIVRMKTIISAPVRSLADMAFDAGYYDQPHFSKDFKIFTGLSPAAFFNTAVYW